MAFYIARRIGLAVPTVVGVVTLVFFLIHLVPGDPVDMMLGETAAAADRARLREQLGLDRPLPVQCSRGPRAFFAQRAVCRAVARGSLPRHL